MEGAQPTQTQCPQCGMYHPPIVGGGKCPMAKSVAKETGKEYDLNQFFATFKTILESQIDLRGIKDVDAFTKALTVNVMKFCETYEEK